MQMWKANNASHIHTAAAVARPSRRQNKTGKLQLSMDEKKGAGQEPTAMAASMSLGVSPTWPVSGALVQYKVPRRTTNEIGGRRLVCYSYPSVRPYALW